jgi:hypothetical protein
MVTPPNQPAFPMSATLPCSMIMCRDIPRWLDYDVFDQSEGIRLLLLFHVARLHQCSVHECSVGVPVPAFIVFCCVERPLDLPVFSHYGEQHEVQGREEEAEPHSTFSQNQMFPLLQPSYTSKPVLKVIRKARPIPAVASFTDIRRYATKSDRVAECQPFGQR